MQRLWHLVRGKERGAGCEEVPEEELMRRRWVVGRLIADEDRRSLMNEVGGSDDVDVDTAFMTVWIDGMILSTAETVFRTECLLHARGPYQSEKELIKDLSRLGKKVFVRQFGLKGGLHKAKTSLLSEVDELGQLLADRKTEGGRSMLEELEELLVRRELGEG